MKVSHLKVPLFVISCIFLGILTIVIQLQKCRTYSCIRFPNQHSWMLKEEYENSKAGWRGMLVYKDQLLRMEILNNVSPHEAQVFTSSRLARIQGLYDTVVSPYPGAISQTIRCNDELKPKLKKLINTDGLSVQYFSGALNSRMQYGSCVDNQIVYASSVGMLYCEKTGKWLQIELILDVSHPLSSVQREDFIKAFSCGVE